MGESYQNLYKVNRMTVREMRLFVCLFVSGYIPTIYCCEHGNEPLYFVQCQKCIEFLSDF
jgi:hypothetical protein